MSFIKTDRNDFVMAKMANFSTSAVSKPLEFYVNKLGQMLQTVILVSAYF